MSTEKPAESAAWDVDLDELIERARRALTPEQAAILDERIGKIRAMLAEASAEPGALNGVAAAVSQQWFRARGRRALTIRPVQTADSSIRLRLRR